MTIYFFPDRNRLIKYLKVRNHNGRYIWIAFDAVGEKSVKPIGTAEVQLIALTLKTGIDAKFIALKPVAYREVPRFFCAWSES